MSIPTPTQSGYIVSKGRITRMTGVGVTIKFVSQPHAKTLASLPVQRNYFLHCESSVCHI